MKKTQNGLNAYKKRINKILINRDYTFTGESNLKLNLNLMPNFKLVIL